jgi:ribonuclease HI
LQKAELAALMWVLQLAAGVRVNIYTDSKYASTTIHVQGVLYKERGFINLEGKNIKYGQEILKLLDAVWAPKWVAIIYYQGHQKGDTIAQGNQKADKEAKQVALMREADPTVLTADSFPCS